MSRGGAAPTLLLAALLFAAASLVAGLGGGLARFGVAGVGAVALAHHGALMVGGFFGTLIALERAVALRIGAVAPLLSGAGAALLLATGDTALAALAWIGAGVALVALYVYAGMRRAWSLHLVVELAGAACWPLGTLAWWLGDVTAATLGWSAFLLLTIAGERRELAQFVRVPRWGQAFFVAAVGAVLAAVAWRFFDPARDAAAQALWWAGAAALALWLWRFDIALRQWRAPQWRGHTARCLVVGYVWLLAACVLHFAGVAGASLHALLLGFVFAMVFAHAPIMLPALAGLQPRFTHWALAPLAVMAASLVLRIAGAAAADADGLRAAGVGHALAIALFAVVMVQAVLRGGRAGAEKVRSGAAR